MRKLKRNSVTVLLLVALLSIAVYLNMAYQDDGGSYEVSQEVGNPDKILGEARAVGNMNIGSENAAATTNASVDNKDESSLGNTYFSEARLNRAKSRDEAVMLLETIVNNPEAGEEAKADAFSDISEIAENINNEARVESLIIAKGFDDCVVFISDGKANVVIKAGELDQLQAVRVKEIIISEIGIKAENIKIMTTN